MAWLSTVDTDELFLSVLVLGEIRRGIEQVRIKDPVKARSLERWLDRLQQIYQDRILPVTAAIADEWGRMNVSRPLSTIDGLMAATANVHNLTLVTRNVSDVAHTGVAVLNPFD